MDKIVPEDAIQIAEFSSEIGLAGDAAPKSAFFKQEFEQGV